MASIPEITEEKFEFSAKAKRSLFITFGIGVVLLIIGVIWMNNMTTAGADDHHAANETTQLLASADEAAAGHGHEEHGGGAYPALKRFMANLWLNNMLFTGISLIGIFFLAVHYVSYAAWSAALKRVMEAFGGFIPVAGVLVLIVFVIDNHLLGHSGHNLFHWTHHGIMDPESDHYDAIIAGKQGYLNYGFFYTRMFLYFGLWTLMWFLLRKQSLQEDLTGGYKHYWKMVTFSAIFLIIFGVTSSTSAWDWILSIDTHWFSTMFGWYVFASWFVTGLAGMTLMIIILKQNGYLKIVTQEHVHDMGKFVFGFSVFWTYIWFSQFMLTYYANISEESIYFIERLFQFDFNGDGTITYVSDSNYAGLFYFNLIINFFFPFLFLMTRDAKRQMALLKVACVGVLIGHWFDFYLMIFPGTMKEQGGLGLESLFVELPMTMIYVSVFLFVVLTILSKASLVAKNHPMMKESATYHT